MTKRDLETPLYPLQEAARLAGTTASALARWASPYRIPRHYAEDRIAAPLIVTPEPNGTRAFSFLNLIEAHFIVVYRKSGVPLRAVQLAVDFARGELDDPHPLRRAQFETDGRALFKKVQDEFGFSGLVSLSSRGQLAWPELVADFFDTVEYSDDGVAKRWWPQGRRASIICDPRFAFGYPVVVKGHVRTDALVERFEAGESFDDIALDFDLEKKVVEDAVRFEMGLRKAA